MWREYGKNNSSKKSSDLFFNVTLTKEHFKVKGGNHFLNAYQ